MPGDSRLIQCTNGLSSRCSLYSLVLLFILFTYFVHVVVAFSGNCNSIVLDRQARLRETVHRSHMRIHHITQHRSSRMRARLVKRPSEHSHLIFAFGEACSAVSSPIEQARIPKMHTIAFRISSPHTDSGCLRSSQTSMILSAAFLDVTHRH